VTPASFAGAAAPAFRAKAGRIVVLALTNRGDIRRSLPPPRPIIFRLLDRLDDGWKPFWLDTLAIDPGQDPAHRLCGPKRRALADGDDGDRLGRRRASCDGTVSSEETKK